MESEAIVWGCKTTLEKFRPGDDEPYEAIHEDGNLLLYGGASAVWERFIGTAINAYNNANSYIGVGSGSTAALATQTALVGPSFAYNPMVATYPQHTDGTAVANASIVFKSSYAVGEALFAWNEWGLFNAAAGAGRLLNRKVVNYGTKGAEVWTLTVTLSVG